MEALQAIPGFSAAMKAFMNSFSERIMYIENMATHVRISEKQLPEYHAMLIDICDKLGIDVPDLFLKLDVIPNAYTSGETKPFIVITSGLLETVPEKLIPTVLAHECGHIVCHHVLYRTMGSMILSGALMIPMGVLAVYPLMAAFHRWMRCSELSADRVAVLCDGNADNLTEMCMRFAGFGKNIAYDMNVEAFMEQAEEYRQLIADNKKNKTLEQMRFSQNTHPINVLRASEARAWTETENYGKAKRYFDSYQKGIPPFELPVSWNEKSFNGKNYDEAVSRIKELGFTNVTATPVSDKALFIRENAVTSVTVNNASNYKEGEWAGAQSQIDVKYYRPDSEKKVFADQPKGIRLNHSHTWYFGRKQKEAEKEFRSEGFEKITCEPIRDITDPDDRNNNSIITVKVGGEQIFRRGDTVPSDTEIVITYHDLNS